MIKSHGGEKAVARWNEFDMCSFVDDNPSMAWCTGPNCGRVVECKVDLEPHQQLDVRCTCGNVFCFNCKEEAHTPVSTYCFAYKGPPGCFYELSAHAQTLFEIWVLCVG